MDWTKQVAKMIADYPPLAEFIDTYEHPAMSGPGVFRGKTCKMVIGVLEAHDANMQDSTTPLEVLRALCLTLEEDFLLALRFLYYVKAKPVIPDPMYDAAERDFLERPEVEDSPLMNPGSDNVEDYPPHVRALAFYLSMMGWQRGQESGAEAKQVELPLGDPRKPATAAPQAAQEPRPAPAARKPKPKPPGYVEAPEVGTLF